MRLRRNGNCSSTSSPNGVGAALPSEFVIIVVDDEDEHDRKLSGVRSTISCHRVCCYKGSCAKLGRSRVPKLGERLMAKRSVAFRGHGFLSVKDRSSANSSTTPISLTSR